MRPWGYIHQNTYEYSKNQQVFTTFFKLYLIIFATQNPPKKHAELFPKPLDSHHCLAPRKCPPKKRPSWFWGPVVSIGRPWTRLLGQPALLFLTSVHGPWDSWSVSCCEIPLWICLRFIDIMPKQWWWTNVCICSIPINKLLYFEWSPPWHVGWRLSGEGCHWEYDGKNGEFENIDFRFPWLSDTSEIGFGHDVPFLNYSDRLPHPSDLCQPDRVRWG